MQVESIQSCGGQMTADGKRLRNGGGILWNILKAREPKAYKEIMVKGREFEVQNYALESSIICKKLFCTLWKIGSILFNIIPFLKK